MSKITVNLDDLIKKASSTQSGTVPMGDSISIQNIEYKTDDNVDGIGFISYSNNTGVVTVTTPSYVKVIGFDTTNYINFLLNGGSTQLSILNAVNIVTIEINEKLRPCCKFYSPSIKQLSIGAEQIPDYPYASAKKNESCSNRELGASDSRLVRCVYSVDMGACPNMEVSDWQDVAIAYEGDEPTLKLQKIYRSFRMPYYRVVNVLDEIQEDLETPEQFHQYCSDKALNVVGQKTKNSYFKLVLS